MAQINVTQFAQQLGLPTALLMEQLQAAGVNKAFAEDTPLSEKDKTQLLEHLRKSHGANEGKQKITLTRRQTTEIKKSDSLGKSRTIQIEVRKKRVLMKRDASEPEAASELPKPVLDAGQIALREAEAKHLPQIAYPAQNSLTGRLRAASAKAGNPDFYALWAGQAVGLARSLPAAQLIAQLEQETLTAIRTLAALVKE